MAFIINVDKLKNQVVVNNIDSYERPDLNETSVVLESVFVELPNASTTLDKHCVIGIVYKPLNCNVYEFLDAIIPKYFNLKKKKRLYILWGILI